MTNFGSWSAQYRDGPAAGEQQHIFAMGPVWEWIAIARMPEPHGWQIIDGSGMPPGDRPCPGAVMYRLIMTEESDDALVERTAYYQVVGRLEAVEDGGRERTDAEG